MFRFMIVSITFVLLFLPFLMGEEKVVIAVASDGETLEAAVSHLAARGPYFLIVDGDGNLSEVIKNPYKDNRGGAGVSAANFLAEKNVTIVIAGNIGHKMIAALKAQDIDYFEFEGIVEDAVRKILEKIGRS
ncbi:NifB/NifX family molybdenum-iron cluster-binding protein [Acidobacteriota bacterium]